MSTSATSEIVFILLPSIVLTRRRHCPWCLMCDPLAPLKPTPLCDLEVASSGFSVHTDLRSTLSTAPESTNASNSFPPRVPSFRSVTELMVVVGSSSQSRAKRVTVKRHWTALFRHHPRLGNHLPMGRSLARWLLSTTVCSKCDAVSCLRCCLVSSLPDFLSRRVDWS